MTGRIAGGAPPRRDLKDLNPVFLGSNQVGLRALNERLVLSLVRIHGQLSKAQIAEITGLTAQTASVIVRALEADGLLMAGKPVRGKVGQPSVPMSINPNGVLFLGLRLGPRGAELTLVNFAGRILAERGHAYERPDPEAIMLFLGSALDAIRTDMTAAQRARLHGMGVAASPDLFRSDGGARGSQSDAGTVIDRLAAEIEPLCGLPVLIQNEAMAACSAELAYGLGGGVSDFLYVHLGDEIDRGIVQHGQIPLTRTNSRSGIGRMLVPGPQGGLRPLADLALSSDQAAAAERQLDSAEARFQIEDLVRGLAHVAHAASTLLPLTTVIIDGSLPPAGRRKIVQAVKALLASSYAEGHSSLNVREGTMGRQGATLGAACLPLLDGFFLTTNGNVGR